MSRCVLRDEELGADFAGFCDGALAEPYAFASLLREHDPLHWSDRLDAWVVSRYEDVLAGLSDPRYGNDRIAAYMAALTPENQQRFRELGEHVGGWLGFTDPPRHTRLRALVREDFTPRLAVRLRPLIQGIVDGIMSQRSGAVIDVVADLAYPLPAAVICSVLGIPEADREAMKRRADGIVPFTANIGPSLNDVAPSGQAALQELTPYFVELIARRAREPQEDLLTRMSVLVRERQMTEAEAVSLAVFVFVAGFETTTGLIANSLLLLLRNPAERERLRRDRSLVPTAVEEFLRYESPIQMLPRLAKNDIDVRGQHIQSGETVILLLGSANRDGAQFPDPDRLDLGRTPNRHLAFGWAAHFCLGAPLARLEAELAVMSFFDRFPASRITEEPHWIPSMTIRCPRQLLVDVGRAADGPHRAEMAA